MHPAFATSAQAAIAVPIWFVTAATWAAWREELDSASRVFAAASGFVPKPGRHLALPAADGKLAAIMFALENADAPERDFFLPRSLPALLPPSVYRFANAPHDARLAALALA